MSRKFIVTVQRTITTEIFVDAVSAKDARWQVDNYGPDLAAVDMASQDISTTAKIKSVRPAQ
jgi:ketosteroid isomerase-like protein